MAPVPGDSPKTPAWHIDAVRGPSTPSLDHLVGAGEQRRRHVERHSPNGTLWNVQRPTPESLGLDIGCPDHLGPHLNLGRDAGSELLRRARDQVVAKGSKPLLHVRLREDFGALAVKDHDN